PLGEEAVGAEPARREGKEVPGEEVRDTRHPGVRRLGDDDVVRVLGRAEDMAGVILVEAEPRIVARVVVHGSEQVGRLYHGGLDLDGRESGDGSPERRSG